MFVGDCSDEYIPIVKKVSENNVIRSKNVTLCGGPKRTSTRKEIIEEAKKVGVKYTCRFSKDDLLKKISDAKGKKRPEKTIIELRKMAKEKGIKRINSFSKKELVEKLS